VVGCYASVFLLTVVIVVVFLICTLCWELLFLAILYHCLLMEFFSFDNAGLFVRRAVLVDDSHFTLHDHNPVTCIVNR
jgi:hypothetical protein